MLETERVFFQLQSITFMLLNYIKTAWRNLHRNKFFSGLNIMGMALGVTCSLLIMLWIQHELSIDGFHANNDRLYKVYEREYYNNVVYGNYDMSALLADEIKKTIPEAEYAIMMNEENDLSTFQAGDKIQKEEGLYAGKDIFKMFTYPLLYGTPASALSSRDNIAISRKMAGHFFGSAEAAMGKSIRFENRKNYIVSAVFEDLPSTASRTFDYLISWDTYLAENDWARRWDNTGPLAYVLLRKDADATVTDKKFTHLLDGDSPGNASYHVQLGLQPYKELYLHNNFRNGYPDGGRIEYVRLFSIVAAFILLIACINFMNLTTARSVKRAKEIGVRKVSGALRSSLIGQFMGESLLLTMIAVAVSLVLVTALLPLFNHITQKDIQLPFGQPMFWLQLATITVITGLLAGSYPAFFLSSFQPVRVLKGVVKPGNGTLSLRKILVIFQFSLSVLLIIGTMVVSKQINYVQHKNLGYDRENLVDIPIEGELVNKYALLKEKATELPGIQSITRMTGNSTNFDSYTNTVDWDNRPPEARIEFAQMSVGYNFSETMKLQMAEGRDFSREFPTDTTGVLLNETAIKAIGYNNPVGRTFNLWGTKKVIIGVIKDFHFKSLHAAIKPTIIYFNNREDHGHLMVRTQAGKTKEALASLEILCKELNPAFPFSYRFTDEEYQKLYRSEQIVGKLSGIFAALAIFISCLGLLGLAMFTAEQRIKEISIRKVLGASVQSLFVLLSREFLILIFIALVIASPLSWLAMNNWLHDFAYRIDIGWQVFIIAGVLSLLIALATVSVQAIKAAMVNPVKNLKEN
ncbi:MAG: ABC transporter permease [Chitinophagaceae bacterium]